MPTSVPPSHLAQFELKKALNAFRNESVSELAGYVDRIASNMKYERSSVNNAISTMHAYIAQGFYAEVMAAYKSWILDLRGSSRKILTFNGCFKGRYIR